MAKKNLSPKAIRLLRRVARHILAEPRRYDQKNWGRASRLSPCGTAACLAGWCDILSQKPRPTQQFLDKWTVRAARDYGWEESAIHRRARRAIGIDLAQAAKLFRPQPETGWPLPFAARWAGASSMRQRARIAAARIEHFIKTDGAE